MYWYNILGYMFLLSPSVLSAASAFLLAGVTLSGDTYGAVSVLELGLAWLIVALI